MPIIIGKPVTVPGAKRAIVPARKTTPQNSGIRLSFPDLFQMYTPIKWIGKLTKGLWPISKTWAGRKLCFTSGELHYIPDLTSITPVATVTQSGSIGIHRPIGFNIRQDGSTEVCGDEMRMLETALKRYFSKMPGDARQIFQIEFSKKPEEVTDFFRFMIRLGQKAINTNDVVIFGCKIRLVRPDEMQPEEVTARLILK